MTVQILFFGACRDAAAGAGELTLELVNPATVGGAWLELTSRYPGLSRFDGSILFAVNEEYARREAPLASGDTLAIFPPVSGG